MHPQPVANDVLLRQLQWRYATKKFDPTQKIPVATWQTLEEALVLTPSSYGMQPWKFIVITDSATKEKLVPFSWGQRQIADGSHLVVFAIQNNVGQAEMDRYLDRIVEVRGVAKEALAPLRKMLESDIIQGPRSKFVNEWAARQVYIALGNFMTAAALVGVDTCPMEGIDPAKYDELLGLAKRGLATAVACVAGYRSADDKYAKLAKVRFKVDDMIERI